MGYRGAIDEAFSVFSGPRFGIRFWDDQVRQYGTEGEPSFMLSIENERTGRRLLAEGAMGFGEAYMDGSLRVEGDLEEYLRLRHRFKPGKPSARLALTYLLARASLFADRRKQISYHYDLGNDFFSLLLDAPTLSYSAGKYDGEDMTLAATQQRKLEYISGLLPLSPDARVLDIGSGWGGFALHAARAHGAAVDGVSLSRAQLAYCEKIREENSLSDRLSFSYADMLAPASGHSYDAAVSIESIEHAGRERLPLFFKNVYDALRPGAPFYLQATGRYVPRPVDRWTLKYVFPGGYLPAKQELLDAACAAGFEAASFSDDTLDYVRTMDAWLGNLKANRAGVEGKFGPEFYRLWELWMTGAKVAFEMQAMSLFRMLFVRPQ